MKIFIIHEHREEDEKYTLHICDIIHLETWVAGGRSRARSYNGEVRKLTLALDNIAIYTRNIIVTLDDNKRVCLWEWSKCHSSMM